MKKRIVIPTYKDRANTLGWERIYIESPEYEVIFYEKSDSLPPRTDKKISDGWTIPNFGRSSFAFLWHIVKNYDDLADVEIFTKTHLHTQGIDIARTAGDCQNHNHLQAYNRLRGFIYLDSQNADHQEVLSRAMRDFAHVVEHHDTIVFPAMTIDNFKFPFEVLFADDVQRPLHQIYVYNCQADVNHGPGLVPYHALEECFDEWVRPFPYFLRRENVWSVKKELILANPKSLYEMMLDKIQDEDPVWTMSHDVWCEFWPLFWAATEKKAGL